MMSKLPVRRKRWYRCDGKENLILAQNFAKDAVKAGENLAEEIPKQGQKLGEQAFELGKDKGIFLYSPTQYSYHLFLFQQTKHSKQLNKPVSTFIVLQFTQNDFFSPRC